METEPGQVGGGPPPLLEAVIERLIPGERRIHLIGDLGEHYVSLPRYLRKAAVMLMYAYASHLSRSFQNSTIFELNRLGICIAATGFLSGLSKAPPQGYAGPAEDYG